ncbi:hypothetical protein [Cytobacillus sp. IB215665]|uniref:hypothetical protein n=1 Tax=Cytobacillus sp. IB215665 TaxID=3097357 RepID=UPI002A173C8E|nr:hypothetical protein [Cytobacillus sp. IB215665]MDX8367184.1 hypothetical protein [Cytobacillus sp. IB215665]
MTKNLTIYRLVFVTLAVIISFMGFVNYTHAETEGIVIPPSNEKATDTIIDKDKIMNMADNVDGEELIDKLREVSLKALFITLIISGVLFFIGAIFSSARKLSIVFLFCGLFGYFLINYTDDVLAYLMYAVNEISELL